MTSYLDMQGILQRAFDESAGALRITGSYQSLAERDALLPTGALAESIPRGVHNVNATFLTSGRLTLGAIALRAGMTVSSISVAAGTQGAATSTHCWFALYSSARAKLGVTSDDTAASPWNASTIKTLSLASPVSITSSGLYYVGVVVVATTTPTLRSGATTTGIAGLTPVLAGHTTDTTLTDPASAPSTAGEITDDGNGLFYFYVS